MDNHYETECAHCGKSFWRHNRQKKLYRNKYNNKIGKGLELHEFCCRQCLYDFKNKHVDVVCGWCNTPFKQKMAELRRSKSGLSFCNKSCSAKYNNTQRRRSRRSLSEAMFFDLIKARYPSLDVIANDKTMLEGLEADVAIPSLKLMIEWNGIVHYKPIYGEQKLSKIQSIDARKQEVAERNGLRLIVIPDLVSTKAFVEEAFMNVSKIIDELLRYSINGDTPVC